MADELPVSAAAPAASDIDITPWSPAAETSAGEPKMEAAVPPAVAAIEAVQAAAPTAPATEIEALKALAPNAPAAEIKATAAELGASPRAKTATVASPAAKLSRSNRYALLAATLAIAVGLGAAGGAWGAYKFSQSRFAAAKAAAPAAVSEKTIALQNTVARMQTELAALRTSIDAGNRSTNSQFAKLTDRFDRVDRSQTDRAAKFAKAVETLERLDKRADVAPARDTTGSVPAVAPAPAPAAAAAPQPVSATPASPTQQQHQQAQQPQAPILEGWVVRNVYRGTAIVQSRRFGTMDVEPGDTLPEIGRIQTIQKRDGRWVVVTTRGLIVSMR